MVGYGQNDPTVCTGCCGALRVPTPPNSRGPPMPPSPFAPWQAAHFWAKIALPWAGVPDPGGRPFPSGNTEMSQPAASASLIGLPNFGASAAKAVLKIRAATPASANILYVDMGHCSVGTDGPGRNRVHMVHGEGIHVWRSPRLAAIGDQVLT